MSNKTNQSVTGRDDKAFIKTMLAGVIKVIIIFATTYFVYQILPFDSGVNKGLSLLICIGLLWLTEAINIIFTALLIPVIAVLIGVPNGDHPYTIKESLEAFSHPVIFTFLGGFAISAALQSQKLDIKATYTLMRLTKSDLKLSVLAMFLMTFLLSMWMTNIAAVVMMAPLMFRLLEGVDEKSSGKIYWFALLGLSYTASLGGIATSVGTSPNAITAQEIGYGFSDWIKVALPLASLLAPLVILVIYWKIKPNLNQKIPEQTSEDIPWSLPSILTVLVFVVVVLGWIFEKNVANWLGIGKPTTWIALAGVFLIAVLGLATWKEISSKTNWGVLLLCGGGLSLSVMLKGSGASAVLGDLIASLLGSLPLFLIILALIALVMLMTEFTSNTATAALLVPVVASAAPHLGVNTEILVLTAGICSSFAFMLPISTPPNTFVYGAGYFTQKQMISAGKYASLVSLITLTLYMLFLSQFFN